MRRSLRIYVMLEHEMDEQIEWWNDNAFIKELDARYDGWKSGKDKGYTMEEVNDSINLLRAKRNVK